MLSINPGRGQGSNPPSIFSLLSLLAFPLSPNPGDLRTFVDKVAHHAYRVTDDDIAILKAEGYTEDQRYDLTWTRCSSE